MAPVGKRVLALTLALASSVVLILWVNQAGERRTALVFCDVGQGDGAYLRINNRFDVLVDAGPNDAILGCLGKHMPFYDRTIELVIVSHCHQDHIGGLAALTSHYRLRQVILTTSTCNDRSPTWTKTAAPLHQHQVKIITLAPPRRLRVLDAVFDLLYDADSLICLYSQKQQRVLFTGDADAAGLDKLLVEPSFLSRLPITILKVPHHGSKTALNRKLYLLAHPAVAVISVGAKNSYGHPAPDVLAVLKALKINIKRTDEDGEVVFKF